MGTMFWTKVKAAAACAAMVLATGGAVLAQEAAKRPLEKNIVYVATDGSGDYKTDGTDDHVEINQAISDIHKKGGGTVHLKKGTYVVRDSIFIYGGTVLQGDGWDSVIKLGNRVGWPQRHSAMITTKGPQQGITIRNLKIDGNAYRQTVRKGEDYFCDTIILIHVSDFTFSGVWIGHTTNDAMKLYGCKNVTIENNTCYDDGHEFVYLCGRGENIRILNNTISTRHNSGIRIGSSNRVVVRGNSIRSLGPPSPGGAGIQIELQVPKLVMDDILIEQNRIYNMPGMGITMGTSEASRFRNFRIRNNVIYCCGRQGIVVGNSDNVLVENNTIFNNIGDGIRVTAPKAVIRNNIIARNGGYGISAEGKEVLSSYNNVWGNRLGNYKGSVINKHDISVDPLFVHAPVHGSWRFRHTKGVILDPMLIPAPAKGLRHPGYADDGWAFLDFHLRSTAGRWNGSAWEKDSVTSPCIDAATPKSAYDTEPLPNGKRVNMGAYGNTKEASKSVGVSAGAD